MVKARRKASQQPGLVGLTSCKHMILSWPAWHVSCRCLARPPGGRLNQQLSSSRLVCGRHMHCTTSMVGCCPAAATCAAQTWLGPASGRYPRCCAVDVGVSDTVALPASGRLGCWGGTLRSVAKGLGQRQMPARSIPSGQSVSDTGGSPDPDPDLVEQERVWQCC